MVKRCASPSLKSAKGKNLRRVLHTTQWSAESLLQIEIRLFANVLTQQIDLLG